MRIVGYTFRAETYCPPCVIKRLPTAPGEDFDGWAVLGPPMEPEADLNEIAAAFGIDRAQVGSDYFPKAIPADRLKGRERCGRCGRFLG